MNWIDALIVLLLLGSFTRGVSLGLVRQVGSTAGFFGGLFLGAFIDSKFLSGEQATGSRIILSLLLTFGLALFCSSVGEYFGSSLKQKMQQKRIDKLDRALGSVVGGVTLLAGVWLAASLFGNVPSPTLQTQIRTSAIVSQLNQRLPAAPKVIAQLGNLIEPNGFPQVFTGAEPSINTDTPLPSIGELDSAVQQDRPSVVKIEGRGCGGVVEGSGFVAADGFVATNAHVVAGVSQPTVLDANGEHRARVVWFDPDLDFAVLRTTNLKGSPLTIRTQAADNGTSAAVLGYPGGGDFKADPAVVLDNFIALGRNIYNQGETKRDVYSIKGSVVPGNSGGPLVAKDGAVIGLIFAQSTAYDQVGYALTMQQVVQELNQAQQQTQTVDTGNCAE
jgi:S1-C subfamily serine protease